jgi:aminoglycoside phosphotransferase family enzyme/predicted kinase
MDSQEMHRQLLDPATYPQPTRHIEYRETHISRVYLTDQHAYKLKKPLALGFLDYSTLERRGHFCAEEVRLNRRFAPDIYLGVVELRANHNLLRFDGPGTLVDFAVKMRRLPQERMLDWLLDHTDPELPSEIERLARHLALVFAASDVCHNEPGNSHLAAVRTNCEENLAQTAPLIGPAVSPQAYKIMISITGTLLLRLEPDFVSREDRGYVRDGHGDLHARNICMTEPIRIYDCIEFCRRFRVDDVAAELAFLLMDLDFRGRRDLAGQLLSTYRQQTGDPDLARLLPFYKSYRAWVRGKVEAILAIEPDVAPDLRQLARGRACRYFNLALGYHVPPMLLLTAGLMGVGKSTFSRALADALGASLLRSDVVRKELSGGPTQRRRPDEFNAGLYTPAMTIRTYREMHQQAERLLRAGQTVIVDASFASQSDRRIFFETGARLAIPVHLLYLQCDRETALNRLDLRQAEGTDPSDGRSALFDRQAAAFDPVGDGPGIIPIDSRNAVDYNVQDIICRLLDG